MRTFDVLTAPLDNDPSDPPAYVAGAKRLAPELGAQRLAATVFELPPGSSVCPYHYESDEEWLLVLAGELTVRHPHGEDVLGPGQITAFPVGPAGAHKTTNNSPAPVRLLIFSTHDANGYSVYPDSDKISFFSNSSDERDNVRVRRGPGSVLDYWDGEL
jgi:uncharacterized cupin superfamily protein